ncbi:membrane protein [Cohnella kolymensis]|uniref:Membrane protein n=1 Tax=Cohnella kolymensis TaxID=1590652 RepID=A0ABR5A9D7_9BACL|nr:DUF485 domain-containing protein [Cohnella kolymensis]KIL37580.1 membrane protein [Cohnella kolymensis]
MQKNPQTYSDIARSELFRKLMDRKKRFIVPLTLFFLAFYFTLPVLTAFSNALNQPAFGSVSWGWVFAFAQFIMTWVLCYLYTKKAKEFDLTCEQIKEQLTQTEKGRNIS